MDFEYTKQDLQDKGDAMTEYVQKQFENEFTNMWISDTERGLDILLPKP